MFRLFKDTYKQIPGDYNQANALFGGIDGNGDGLIHANATNQTREGCNVFHHLQEMGMLKNMGLLALQSHNSGANGYIYETDACAILAAPFHRHYYKIARTTSGAVPGIYGNTNNFITIDSISSAGDRWWDTGSVPTDDVAAIDLKIDDGVANSGIVYGKWNCTGGAAGATAGNGGNYLIGSINCQPIYFFTTW